MICWKPTNETDARMPSTTMTIASSIKEKPFFILRMSITVLTETLNALSIATTPLNQPKK